jgi:hypothetical protein
MSYKFDQTFQALHGAITSFVGCRAFKELEQQCDIGQWYADVDKAIKEHWGATLTKSRA